MYYFNMNNIQNNEFSIKRVIFNTPTQPQLIIRKKNASKKQNKILLNADFKFILELTEFKKTLKLTFLFHMPIYTLR